MEIVDKIGQRLEKKAPHPFQALIPFHSPHLKLAGSRFFLYTNFGDTMHNFLERFKALNTHEQKEKFLIEINARIDSSAYFTDQLKKNHHVWNKETNDLCILRDLIIDDMKEKK